MNMSAQIGFASALAAPVPAEFGLSALDWRVVALARVEADRHGTAAFRPRGRLGRFWDRLVGGRGGVPGLADERLEAMRRFVGLARRRDARVAAAAAALAALGVTTPAVELLRAAAVE